MSSAVVEMSSSAVKGSFASVKVSSAAFECSFYISEAQLDKIMQVWAQALQFDFEITECCRG